MVLPFFNTATKCTAALHAAGQVVRSAIEELPLRVVAGLLQRSRQYRCGTAVKHCVTTSESTRVARGRVGAVVFSSGVDLMFGLGCQLKVIQALAHPATVPVDQVGGVFLSQWLRCVGCEHFVHGGTLASPQVAGRHVQGGKCSPAIPAAHHTVRLAANGQLHVYASWL